MPFASLYQKYRPQTFSEIIGQPHVARTLANAVERGHIFHAYLFSGPRGTGKTSTARILAKAVNCENGPTPEPCGKCQPCTEIAAGTFPDVFEIDAATHSKVEETRDFLSNVPAGLSALSRKKFYIIDEVHMLSSHAFNALLKTLEEPPSHVVFVLATTEPHKVPPTIAGRCQHFEFRLISPSELAAHYAKVCEKEGIEFEPEAIERVAALARGSARDGLSLLDQLVAATEGRITIESVSAIAGDDEVDNSAALARSIATGDLESCLELVGSMAESGRDFRSFAQRFAGYLRNLMVASYLPTSQTQTVASVDSEGAEELSDIAKLMGRPSILRCLDIAGEVLASISAGSPPQLAFELGIVRMCRPEEAPPLSELSRSIDELRNKLVRLEQKLAALTKGGASGGIDPGTAGTGPDDAEVSAPAPSSKPREVSEEPSRQVAPSVRVETPVGKEFSTREEPSIPKKLPAPRDAVPLESKWESLLSALKAAKKMKARALLQEARPVSIEGSTLVLEYSEKYEFHAKGAGSLGSTIADEMRAIFGSPLKIEARLASGDVDGENESSNRDLGDTADPSEKLPATAERPGAQPRSAGKTGSLDQADGSDSPEPIEPMSGAAEPPGAEAAAREVAAHKVAEKLIEEELGGTPISE